MDTSRLAGQHFNTQGGPKGTDNFASLAIFIVTSGTMNTSQEVGISQVSSSLILLFLQPTKWAASSAMGSYHPVMKNQEKWPKLFVWGGRHWSLPDS